MSRHQETELQIMLNCVGLRKVIEHICHSCEARNEKLQDSKADKASIDLWASITDIMLEAQNDIRIEADNFSQNSKNPSKELISHKN